MMLIGNNSEGGNVPDIQSLNQSVRALNASIAFWNELMIFGLAIAAVAAVFVVIAARVIVNRAGQLSAAQNLLSAAKDRQLQVDLKEKDLEIGNLKLRSDVAELGIAAAQAEAAKANLRAEQEKLERIKLEEDLSPRLFKNQQDAVKRLSAFRGTSVALQYPLDPESKRTAEQIAFVLDGAGWKILPKINTDPNPIFREGITVGGAIEGGAGVVPVDAILDTHSPGVALMEELNKTGLDAHTVPGIPRETGSVFVNVGIKPSPEDRKIMKHIAEIQKRVAESISKGQTLDITDLTKALKKDAREGTTGGRFILPGQ
jgi:hypothetical protein